MRAQETVELVNYIKLMFPTQRVEDSTPDVWHDGLWSLSLADARLAVASLAGRQKFVAVSEIHAEVRLLRSRAPLPVSGGAVERRCPWPQCRCTHQEPCFKGWVDEPEKVRPCGTCRPEVARYLEMGPDVSEHRDGLRTLPRPSRQPMSLEGP